jgi:hypothetical protein
MRRNLRLGLIALVFLASAMSAEVKVSDDSSGLRLADNELGQSPRAPVEYIWSDEIPSDSTAALGALATNQSDEQVDNYFSSDGLVTVAAMGLAVILLGGLSLVRSALRRREAWPAGRPGGWSEQLMEFVENDIRAKRKHSLKKGRVSHTEAISSSKCV